MSGMIPAFISGVSAIAGGAMNSYDQRQANEANIKLAAQQNAFNERMQREQWARDDKAYSRAVVDMQNAGLNPLAGVSPQSSPLSVQGADASVESLRTGDVFNGFANAFKLQNDINTQNKMVALNAIRSGVNPQELDKFDDQELIDLYRSVLSANGQQGAKSAGIVGKVYNDAKNIVDDLPNLKNKLPEPVKKVVDRAIANQSRNLRSTVDLVNEISDNPAVKDFVGKVSDGVKKTSSKVVEYGKKGYKALIDYINSKRRK